jgi:hypothetical protein
MGAAIAYYTVFSLAPIHPNVEFFGLDDVMPSNLNDRVTREQTKIPDVRNWAVRDYGNRVGIWRLMEVLTR